MPKLPILSVDLIKELDEQYPERVPSLNMTDREIWAYVGQRELVRYLLRRLAESEEEDETNITTEGV